MQAAAGQEAGATPLRAGPMRETVALRRARHREWLRERQLERWQEAFTQALRQAEEAVQRDLHQLAMRVEAAESQREYPVREALH